VSQAVVASKSDELTPLGSWLERHGISYATAAGELGVTRAYIHSLATGKSSPTIKFAAKIAVWARALDEADPLEVSAWVPFCS